MISSRSRNLLQRLLDHDWAAIGWKVIVALGRMSTIPVTTEYGDRAADHRWESRSSLELCEKLWSLPVQRESRRGPR